MLSFSFLFYLSIGREIDDYRDFVRSFQQCFSFLINYGNIRPLMETNKVMTTFAVVTYAIVVIVLIGLLFSTLTYLQNVFNLLGSIIVTALERTAKQIRNEATPENDYSHVIAY